MRIRLFIFLLIFLLTGAAVSAARSRVAQSPEKAAEKQSEAEIPLLAEGLHLADFAGMKPRADLAGKLGHVSGFIQQQPTDGKPASQKTEVWFGYTHSTLYFVFLCFDTPASLLRSHLARRENIMGDDSVFVLLDPFQDRRKGVLFSLNPAGVQADAAWDDNNSGNGPDFSYDQVWDSEGKITSEGWMALIAIPFRSLRFPPRNRDWGVAFMRAIPRSSEQSFWPRVASGVTGVLAQEAILRGIEGVTGSHNIQLNPYSLGQSSHVLNELDPVNPFFSTRKAEGTAGGEAKLVLHDSLILDATINPDFSDVETDQPQFTVNQRYPVFFPELRPFFLENANYFSTPINLAYTRNIVHPEYGVRLTGKAGHTNIGLFAIDDRQPGMLVGAGDPLSHARAKFVVARASRDLGKGSSLGVIYAGEEFGGGWSRVGGVDGIWRVNDQWTLSGQALESSTMGDKDSGTPRPYSAGPAFKFGANHQGHSFNLFSNYRDYSSGFVTHTGFIETANIRNGHVHASYQWFPKDSRLQSYGIETEQTFSFDHQHNRVSRANNADFYFTLPRSTVLAPLAGQSSDTLGPQNGYGFTENHNFTENWAGAMIHSAPWALLNMNVVAVRGATVNFNPAAGKLPTLMNQNFVQANVTLQPLRPLTVDNVYLLDRDHEAHGGQPVYEAQTMRAKLNYQFTRSLSARIIAQYQSTLVNPAETSLQHTKQVSTQALFTWLPHPGTAVYIGYNSDIQNLDRSLCNRLSGGGCDPNNTTPPRSLDYLNDGRQFFIKASYLFRF